MGFGGHTWSIVEHIDVRGLFWQNCFWRIKKANIVSEFSANELIEIVSTPARGDPKEKQHPRIHCPCAVSHKNGSILKSEIQF